MTGQPLLKVDGVETYYGNIRALAGVNVEVNSGEIVSLIGANGAGKSTLMMTICGSPQARTGSVIFEGRDITRMPTHEIARLRIAQSPEGRRIFPRMTVYENLQMGASLDKLKYFNEDVEKIFTLFPRLKERQSQRGGTLSGGEQQMLSIGRALMTNPRLLILDEATEGLAPLIRLEIWNCLKKLKAEHQAILVIDKNVDALAAFADRHVIIEKGRVVWTGTSATLKDDPSVKDRFLRI